MASHLTEGHAHDVGRPAHEERATRERRCEPARAIALVLAADRLMDLSSADNVIAAVGLAPRRRRGDLGVCTCSTVSSAAAVDTIVSSLHLICVNFGADFHLRRGPDARHASADAAQVRAARAGASGAHGRQHAALLARRDRAAALHQAAGGRGGSQSCRRAAAAVGGRGDAADSAADAARGASARTRRGGGWCAKWISWRRCSGSIHEDDED